MVSLESLEPIKQAVGSKDSALLEALFESIGDDDELRYYAEEMIMGLPPASEPGCWNYLVQPLAQHLDLSPHQLPLDDWKHYYVWEEYRSIADPLLSAESNRLLEFMELGRPFVGSSIDHDGCMFAWLTAAETLSLWGELPSDAGEFSDLEDFHEDFVEALKETVVRNADLFLGAH
jgi:hypothetical protein